MKKAILFSIIILFVFTSCNKPINNFNELITSVNNSNESEKQNIVNQFLTKHPNSPIVEDNRVIFYLSSKSDITPKIASEFTGWSTPAEMEHLKGTDFYYYLLDVKQNSRIEYMLMLEDQFKDQNNPDSVYRWYRYVSQFKMKDYVEPKDYIKVINELEGEIQSHTIKSRYLKENRTIKVYIPKSYNNSDKNYKTIYTQDGEAFINDFNFAQLNESLVNNNQIEESIIVFNEPNNRDAEYRGELIEQYKNYFTKELIPYINKKYRSKKSMDDRLIIGYSRGGLISLDLATSYPNLCKNIIAFSPAMDNSNFLERIESKEELNINVFFTVGNFETRWKSLVEKLKTILDSKNINNSFKITPEGHSITSWKQEIGNALKYFLSKN